MRIDLQKYEVDESERTMVFSVASDLPYERYDAKGGYYEVLVVTEEAVDLHRLNGGAALLFNHDTENLIGCVEKAWCADDRLFVQARFSRNDPRAVRVWDDILDGVIRNVSIGYAVLRYSEQRRDGKLFRFVDSWMPYECSIVSIPADETVGIRSMQEGDAREREEENKPEIVPEEEVDLKALRDEVAALKAKLDEMDGSETSETPAEPEKAPETDEAKPEEPAPVDETPNDEEEEIKACGEALKVPDDEVKKAIGSGMTARDFKRIFRNYDNKAQKEKKMASFKDYLREGNFNEKFTFTRDAYPGWGGQTGEGGAALIGTETRPLVAALEKVMGVKGFRTLSGLTSNISIPVQTTRNTIYKTDHLRDAASTSNPVFTPATLTPQKFSGNTRIGKELLVQANDDVVAFIIDSLTKEIAYKIEDYMLGKVATGAGANITYASLSAIDWDDILGFESAVGGFALETPAFVMSTSARAALKGIEKANGTAQFLCMDNEINGYACNVSGCVSNNNIYFGDWSKLLLGLWGEGLEIVVNPYTYAKEGDVELVASLCADAVAVQADAFVLGSVESSSSSSSSSSSGD